MCGICGIWNNPDQAAVASMVAAMCHRGPDDSGMFMDALVSLGMARLAVIDLNPTGHQPMSNPEKTIWIVYNGEIYNFQDERDHLEKLGYRFASTSDTEVALRLYEHYGDDFLLRLRGMFALAIYDLRRGPGKERVLLARDPLGIKPLLYSQVGNQLVFASEIKAILASGLVEREIDPESLRLLLTYGSIYQPKTMLSGVKMLLPAHRLILEDGRVRCEKYWSLDASRRPEIGSLPYPEQVEVVSAALRESVRLQMVSDVPLGAFLSGGVDSSILVAMMTQSAGHRIKTFSVGFDKEGEAIDESREARKTALFLGADHTHVMVRGSDVKERILQIASGLDQPTVDGVNSFFISWAARQSVTVAISGTGGDEMFAGYPWFVNMSREVEQPPSARTKILAALARQRIFDPLIQTHWRKTLYQLRMSAGFLSRYALQYQIYGSLGAAVLLTPDLQADSHLGLAEHFDLRQIDELAGGTVLQRVGALCLRGYTNNQLLRDIDAVSMAHSLEVRVPFLDTVLADITLSLPDESKLRPPDVVDASLDANTYRALGAKRILIDVGRPLLPKDFDIQPKRGFAMPFAAWLEGPLSPILEDALSPDAVRSRGWFDEGEVTSVLRNFRGQNASWAFPWLLMMVELWAREVLDP
ncbi:MAG: asparagine synthase (glutamine-hydrolyzing) [Chloroflexota bacterium]